MTVWHTTNGNGITVMAKGQTVRRMSKTLGGRITGRDKRPSVEQNTGRGKSSGVNLISVFSWEKLNVSRVLRM